MESPPLLLYDGDCGFCRDWVGWAKERGAEASFQPCQDATTIRGTLDVPDSMCADSAIFIGSDGQVFTHQEAIYGILRTLPWKGNRLWRMIGEVGLSRVNLTWPWDRMVYRMISKNRHRLRGPRS